MRKNFFGEQIAQPDDSYDAVLAVLEEQDFSPKSADIEPNADETYRYGGELRNEEGDSFSFDGFESLAAARAFAEQFVDPADVEVMEE